MSKSLVMWKWITSGILATTFAFGSSGAMASDLPVSYRVLLSKTKKQGNGTQLTFNLHTDAACATTPVFTDTVFIEDIALLEELRFVKRLGAPPATRTAHLQHVLAGVTPAPFLFLQVAGAFPLEGEECQQQVLPATNTSFPPGMIALWSGALANLPVGWALCDGANGTPDLRDRFVQGVASGQDPGATGGASTHGHTASHTHPFSATSGQHNEAAVVAGIGANIANENHTHSVSGTTDEASPGTDTPSHLPRFYELAFIMKLP
jgi:hypothetical protein